MKHHYHYATPWVSTKPRHSRQRMRKAEREATRLKLFRANERTYTRKARNPLGDEFTVRDKTDPRTGPLLAPRRYRRKVMRGQA